FGYCSGTVPELGADGRYQVPVARVRFTAVVPDDEVDLQSGFLMMPQTIPVPAPAPGPTVTYPPGAASAPTAVNEPPVKGVLPAPGPPQEVQAAVELTFEADRNQLF